MGQVSLTACSLVGGVLPLCGCPVVLFTHLPSPPPSRVFVSVCRLLGDSERVHFLVCDLLCRPLLPNELPVLVGVASIWPAALGRRPGVAVMERNQLVPAGGPSEGGCVLLAWGYVKHYYCLSLF